MGIDQQAAPRRDAGARVREAICTVGILTALTGSTPDARNRRRAAGASRAL
ncbi:MAG: hypothetical protein ABIQ33_02275 [Caldimonas sp.]